jgi:uncharacterized membrane protein
LAWFMMIYPSWVVARAVLRGIDTRSFPGLSALALVAALVMTAWDTVMDPGMSAAGNWIWEQGGPYFGVPLHNYFGWLLTTFLVYWGAGLLWRSTSSRPSLLPRTFAALPVILYALDALSYMTPRRFAALQIVAVFSMGTPALAAILQTWMPQQQNTTSD